MTTSSYNNHYIPVNVSPGAFSSEYCIELKLADGTIVSFFADKELVKQENEKWLLKVSLVSQEAGKELVLLPSEPFETASRWAEIQIAA